MKLLIVYGSQSLLTNEVLNDFKNQYLIRIYNNRVPEKLENTFDIKSDSSMEVNLEKTINLIQDKIKEVYFLGVGSVSGQSMFWSEKKEDILNAINANITNYLLLTKIFLKLMMRKRHGRIVYLSSFRAVKPTRGTLVYSGSKSFCETFFKGVGIESGSVNVTTHIIRMGAFEGRMLKDLGDKYNDKILKEISIGKFGTSKDLCDTIRFCFKNPYNNSGIIELNGGLDIDI